MNNFVYNLKYKRNGDRVNIFYFLFVYMNVVLTLAFLLFHNTNAVQASILYTQSNLIFGPISIYIWAGVLLTTIVANLIGVGKKYSPFIGNTAFIAAVVWIYAVIVYIQGGFWLQLLTGAVPSMIFWSWLYLDIRRSENN